MDRAQKLEAFEMGISALGIGAYKYRLELLALANQVDLATQKSNLEHFSEGLFAPFVADYMVRALEHLCRRPFPSPLRRSLFTIIWAGYVCSELIMEKVVQPNLYDNRPVQVEQLGLMAAGTALGVFAFGVVHRWARQGQRAG